MKVLENINLAEYTTFKIGGPARFFCIVKNENDINEAVKFAKEKKVKIMPLGGGSNILVSDAGFDGLVMKNEIRKEIKITPSNNKTIVSVGAGEVWDDFVQFSIENNLCGLENLSFIPGTVGASPVQNIGAYGAEVSQFIHKVYAIDCTSGERVKFDNRGCNFGYRNSIFKYYRHRYVITGVDFVFRNDAVPNISYKDLAQYFSNIDKKPNCSEIREAVIEIRKNKLPDWKKWGTAGSFFKNPIISKEHFERLRKIYPDIPGFADGDGQVKVSLGWILDKVCHAKGVKYKKASTYDKQALVIVIEDGGKAEDVVNLSTKLMLEVKNKTGITIESEVEWVA